jgi:hypothetical protein
MKDLKKMMSKDKKSSVPSTASKAKRKMLEELRSAAMQWMADDAKGALNEDHDAKATMVMVSKKKGETRDEPESKMEEALGPEDHNDYRSDMSTDEEYDDGLGSSDNAKASMERLTKRLAELKSKA